MQVPNGTGLGVRRSKRLLLASRTRCNVLWKPPKFGNKVKIGNKIQFGNKFANWWYLENIFFYNEIVYYNKHLKVNYYHLYNFISEICIKVHPICNIIICIGCHIARRSGGVVVKLLACGSRGPGFDCQSRNYDFRDWLSPASKSRYGRNTAKAT